MAEEAVAATGSYLYFVCYSYVLRRIHNGSDAICHGYEFFRAENLIDSADRILELPKLLQSQVGTSEIVITSICLMSPLPAQKCFYFMSYVQGSPLQQSMGIGNSNFESQLPISTRAEMLDMIYQIGVISGQKITPTSLQILATR